MERVGDAHLRQGGHRTRSCKSHRDDAEELLQRTAEWRVRSHYSIGAGPLHPRPASGSHRPDAADDIWKSTHTPPVALANLRIEVLRGPLEVAQRLAHSGIVVRLTQKLYELSCGRLHMRVLLRPMGRGRLGAIICARRQPADPNLNRFDGSDASDDSTSRGNLATALSVNHTHFNGIGRPFQEVVDGDPVPIPWAPIRNC